MTPTPAPAPRAPKALRAFYGASDRQRKTNLNTTKTLIGSPDTDRPQEIYTPPEVRDFLVQLWGSIRLDPCAGPDSILQAERSYYGEQVDTGRKKKDGSPILRWQGEGLAVAWTDCTYFNPPYEDLEEWLAKALAEAELGHEIAGLVPVRPQRGWWREAVLMRADAVGWCNTLKFVGYKSGFPAPLAMPYWGPRVEQFKVLFEAAGLGYAEVHHRG